MAKKAKRRLSCKKRKILELRDWFYDLEKELREIKEVRKMVKKELKKITKKKTKKRK